MYHTYIDMHRDQSTIPQFTEQSWKVGFPNINAFFHSGMFVYTYFLYKRCISKHNIIIRSNE